MAKRKKHTRRHTAVAVRRTKTRRRRRHLSAGGAMSLQNPYIGMAVGVVGAGFVAYMLGKPGKDGKPLIEEPRTRALIIGGAAFAAKQFLKVPTPVVLGAASVATYELAKGFLNKDKQTFGFSDGEISYVSPGLLSDATTLADSVLLSENGEVIAMSPYGYQRNF